jgi:hypothetical protein
MANQKSKLEAEVDALFRLPLAEFTGARNTVAAQLKREKRVDEADFVKTLVKPSVSAWAVNQLYWEHRKEFDRLIDTGARLRKLQASSSSGKLADMRAALETRQEVLLQLSDLATPLLQDAGHSPSLDTLRRITTTLEAMSAYAALPNAPRAGRLTQDVDPPGFESLASFVPSAGPPEKRPNASAPRKVDSVSERRQLAETRQAKIATAKIALKEAKSLLSEVRIRAQRLEAAQKRANAEAKESEKEKRAAEEGFKKAKAAAEKATRNAQGVAAEAEEAANALNEAERNHQKASRELEQLLSS